MKALCKQTMGFILMILLACGVTSIKAQDSADDEFCLLYTSDAADE